MKYAIFINNKRELEIERYEVYEDIYYIYINTKEKCKEFVKKYNFTSYDEFYKFLHKWCDDNNIEFCGCKNKFNDMVI